jgi:peptidoglycan/LPS O-acetylase OafA/YrhL
LKQAPDRQAATTAWATRPISQRESVYLDLVRSLASFVVVLDHAPTLYDLPSLPRWGHQAVMVFFVLSGYVICSVADTRERTLRVFLVARFARLWSVLFPAIALTVLCDVTGRAFGHNPEAYAFAPIDHLVVRATAILTFLSETWVSIQPFSNGVVWSLCAEFWYYMLFAAWVFVPPGRVRIITLTMAVVLSGYKALLLLPIWLMGVLLQRSLIIRRLGVVANVSLWACGLIAIGWVLVTRAYDQPTGAMEHFVGPWIFAKLAQARVFWLDWLFGLAVAAHLLGARTVANHLPLERIAKPVRWCAGVSFAAYLFHMPLLTLSAAFLPRDQGWTAIVLTLGIIGLVGPPVERSKGWWRSKLDRVAAVHVGRKESLILSQGTMPRTKQ